MASSTVAGGAGGQFSGKKDEQPSKLGAFRDQDSDRVSLFCRSGKSGTAVAKHGLTSLHHAARCDAISVMEKLSAGGARVSCAAEFRSSESLHSFHKGLAKVTVGHEYSGTTPLHEAIYYGANSAAESLLESGADPNAATAMRKATPLHIAVERRRLHLVNLLLRKGANVNARDMDELTPLHYALISGSSAVVEVVLRNGADPNALAPCGYNALHFAVLQKWDAIVPLLFTKGVEMNAADSEGYTPLRIAAVRLQFTMCRLLHALAPKPLHSATPELLKARANAAVTNRNGRTPLHLAVLLNQVSDVVSLLDAGESVNAGTRALDTALHMAVQMSSEELVDILLEAGANPNLCNNDGVNPFHLALTTGQPKLAEKMAEKGAHLKLVAGKFTGLDFAARHSWGGLANILLGRGADPNSTNDDGMGPLHFAALSDIPNPCVGILIKRGAKNLRDHRGYTPLHFAARLGQPDHVSLLLGAGALVDEADDEGSTALHHAASANRLEVLDLLLHSGARTDLRDHSGYSALSVAVTVRASEFAARLIQWETVDPILGSSYTGEIMIDTPDGLEFF